MTATHDSESGRPARWLARLRRVRSLLAAAVIVFAGLWITGALAALPALAGFVLITAAALIATGNTAAIPTASQRDTPPAPQVGDPLIEAVLAGLPDPVVALNRQGDVVALNAQASAVRGRGGAGLARLARARGAGGDPPRARERRGPARGVFRARADRSLV